MKNMKRLVGLLAAAVICFTSIPFSGIPAKAAEAIPADAVVRLTPGQASPFNDTNGDGLGEFEGWGTSLCWWANRVGYSEALVEQAAELFFSDKGLDMNIGRYNIGGGDLIGTTEGTPDVEEFRHKEHIIRSDSGVPGYSTDVTKMDLENNTLEYYKENFAATDVESGYAWNYDWDADANQINILKAAIAASGEFHAEAFSNSPPYWMTVSGCSSGNANASRDNLRPECYTAFATYMADVIKHWNDEGIINFQSASPMNEPDSSYWGANSNKQEGCHFENGASQSKVLLALDKALKDRGIDLILAGTDETSIDDQITSYNTLTAEAKAVVERIDTHTYGGSKRAELNALAKEVNKNLWMSEVDGSYTAGSNAGEMTAALGIAQQIIKDLNGLESSAWILWNTIDMHVDSSEYGQKWVNAGSANDFLTVSALERTWRPRATSAYWGLAAADHDNEEIILSMKYYGFGQLSRYIRPGDTLIHTSSSGNTLAAYDSAENKVVIVTTNTTAQDQTWKFDLSLFNEVSEEAKVTAIRTSGSMATGELWADVSGAVNSVVDASGKAVTADLKANSITTFIIEGVTYDPENPVVDSVVEIDITADMVTGSAPWNNGSDDATKAVDGNLSTFFDGVTKGWLKIDLGEETEINAIAYAPRSGYEDRCVNASIYGSHDGETWELLHTITSRPSSGTLTSVYDDNFESGENVYRYIRYAVPENDANANCNIAEIKVYATVPAIESVKPITAVVTAGEEPELPSKVTGITTEGEEYELSVEWNVNNAVLDSLKLYQSAEVTGVLAGTGLTATAEITLVPENLEYLIDCHNPNSKVWKSVSENVDTLLNTEAPDQAKTAENAWGYTFVPGGDAEHWDYEKSGNSLYEYGYWAYSRKNITYDVTLSAGMHNVMVGGFDFWNGRTCSVYYSINGGAKQSLCTLSLNNNYGTDASGTIIVPEDNSVVTISVEKYRNGGDPILGFISINEVDATAEAVSGVAYNDGTLVLPETVKVSQGNVVKDANVIWNTDGVNFNVKPFTGLTLTGIVEGFKNLTTTAEVLVVPENMEYMIDCNNLESTKWAFIKEHVDTLLNTEAPDQAKTDDNTWGYISTVGLEEEDVDMTSYSQNDVSNPYAGGWWAHSNADISYQVTLPRGQHTILMGCTGWWSMARQMDVYYSVDGGAEVKLFDFDAVRNAEIYVQGTIELQKESVVTLKVRKARNDDPILSWIGVAYAGDVENPFEIVAQPEDTSARAGETVNFTVEATGEGLTYQWQYCNESSDKWYNSSMTGSNTDTVTVPVTSYRDGQKYRCVITDASGETLTSEVAVMAVDVSKTLKIVSEPLDYMGAVDGMAEFTVKAEGEGLTYQWQYSNANSGKWYNSSMEGSNAETVNVPVKTYRDGQKYRCIITDAQGYTVTTAVVYLEVAK